MVSSARISAFQYFSYGFSYLVSASASASTCNSVFVVVSMGEIRRGTESSRGRFIFIVNQGLAVGKDARGACGVMCSGILWECIS